MSTRSDSTTKSSIVSYPSVSSALHSLPQATSLQHVSLHPNMYANRAAESEAKLQKALLSKSPSSFTPQPQQMVYRTPHPSSSQDSSPQLTMRTKSKFSS